MVGLLRRVLVIALVVGILRGLRDYRNARNANGVKAHRLRLCAWRERTATRENRRAGANRRRYYNLQSRL